MKNIQIDLQCIVTENLDPDTHVAIVNYYETTSFTHVLLVFFLKNLWMQRCAIK